MSAKDQLLLIQAPSTTHCLGCGTPVVLAEVVSTLGRCPECSRRDDSPRAPADVQIVGRFFPGFAEDLTSWEIRFFSNGAVQQVINWCSPDYKSKRRETRETQIDAAMLTARLNFIASIDRLGIAELNDYCIISDAADVTITAPVLGFRASLPLWAFASMVHEEDMPPMPPRAKNGLATFQAAWEAIDAVSPYTTAEHWQLESSSDE